MAWYDEAVFYHIYPLGMTGAPKLNSYEAPVHRLNKLLPWISHIKKIGCNAIYIGPLFESVGHGYETTDYKKLDSRLGTNEDLTAFVAECHRQGIRVILDGVFNHTGRDFFAFKDIKNNREHSQYKDWYCNVNFWGNNSYNDGFSYENWGGYDLLVKLNQHNPAVRDYICDVIRFWVSEFDIDGIRLDAADVMDFEYMQALRHVANEVKPDFWLMGEVIHGNYSRWANEGTLHSVTNYMLHKALYSGHNDHNYFEIAHTIKYVRDMIGDKLNLYTFVDNHDVERIYTKLRNKAHFAPVHIMLYTLPGIPAIYYGSELGIEGRKEHGSDDSLRPELNYEDYRDSVETNPCTKLIAELGRIRHNTPALCYGAYREMLLQTTHFAYSRTLDGKSVITTVNNADNEVYMDLEAGGSSEYVGALSGERVNANGGYIHVRVPANYGEIWIPAELYIEKNNNEESQLEAEQINEESQLETDPVKQECDSEIEVAGAEDNSRTIGILGLGRTARAMAAYLMDQGSKVVMWGRNREVAAELREKGITVSGRIEGHFTPQIEEELSTISEQADYLFVMTTAAGHRDIAEGLKGKLRRDQRIVIFNGNWGAYEFYQVLKDELQEKKVVVGETGGMIFIADYDGEACNIKSIKNIMSLATFPAAYAGELVEELKPVLPQLKPEENVVVTSINNSNPVIHVPLVLFNYTRIENGEDFGFYKEGATPSAIRYVEAIDEERGNAARAAGVSFQSCLDIINSFWTDKKDNLYEAMTQNQTYISVKGPKTLKHRYMEEDLPYGIMPLIALGKAYGIEMKRMEAMAEALCCLLQHPELEEPFSISREVLEQLIHAECY